MKKGFLSIILHAHLPYVHHPEYEHFFEENWLFEAMTECYIPLIGVFDRLQDEGVQYRLTLSLSPTLITLLRNPLLQSRYQAYLKQRVLLAEKEIKRTQGQVDCQRLARLYRRFFSQIERIYHSYQGDLIQAFKKHADLGSLELMTTAATHGFLPVLISHPVAVKCQIEQGIRTFQANLGIKPEGFWLPECGFFPGLEKTLQQAGVHYFFTDQQHDQDPCLPWDCGNGVVTFLRHTQLSACVWDAKTGYPGHRHYRDYYRDIGFDLDCDLLADFVAEENLRVATGIKYYSIAKEPEQLYYNPRRAASQVRQDAVDFIERCQQQIEQTADTTEKPPILIVPFDAELFGHWWFEGISWLEHVIKLAEQSDNLSTQCCREYLHQYEGFQVTVPPASSWGEGGYASYWINDDNDWIYPFLVQATEQMEKLVVDFSKVSSTPLQQRALNQALRSLLLAQASDWAFILKSGTTTEYAKKRITDHLARFNYLHQCIRHNHIDEHYLRALEIMDDIFPDIDYRCFLDILPTSKGKDF